MTYCLDVELFISEVKKYPEIWDLNCEEHRYKSRKQRAWAEIARVFINDFDDMPEIEKLDVYRKLHGKWRNIRDSYVRHIKRKYGKRGYMYAKYLSFLDNIYKHSNSGSDAEGDNNDDTWASDADESKISKLYLNKGVDIKNDNWLSDAEDTPLENVKRKRKNSKKTDIEYVEPPFAEAACSYAVAEDDDRSFFESLLPAVRGFDLDQKLEFRSRVIALVKSIRSNVGKFKIDPGSDDD